MAIKKQQDSTERFSRLTALISVFFIALVGVTAIAYSFAAPKNGGGGKGGGGTTTTAVNMYLSPSSQRVAVGDEFTESVWVDVGAQTVNAVQANLTFDASKLAFVSVDSTNSAFGVEAQAALEGNTVKIARGSFSDVTGNSFVANVKFRAVGSGRNSQVTFTTGSAVINSQTLTDILEKTTKATVTIR